MGILWQAVGAADVQSVLEDGSSLLYGRLVSLKRDEREVVEYGVSWGK